MAVKVNVDLYSTLSSSHL